MATMFPERERAFEAKFAHDEELRFLSAHAATGCLPSGPPRCWGCPVKKVMPWLKQYTGFPTGQGMIKPCCSTYPMSYLHAAAKPFEETHPLLSRDARKTRASKS